MSPSMERLAILGGPPVRARPYPPHITTDEADWQAVQRVLQRGILSDFEGANTPNFWGGPEIKTLEAEWAERFGVRHAVAMNSATSCLMAAVGAVGVGPGDEVILPPWTMTATASAILAYHAVPVFCDIEEDVFTLDPAAVRRAITPRTRAIMPVHLFGHPARMDPLLDLARAHGLAVIEDAAQSPGAAYRGRLTGTLGQIGVFSLNSNKIIQCGEGGVAVTNDDELALRLRLIRNHAEAVIATGMSVKNLVNMVGWNLRMTELEAAIARVQLRKLDRLLQERRAMVDGLNRRVAKIPGLIIPPIQPGCTHSYYRYPLKLDPRIVPIPGRTFVRILNAEGMDFYPGYELLYLQPLYQQRLGFGEQGCPFRCGHYQGDVSYEHGICPVAERLQDEVISTEVIRPPLTENDVEEIVTAFSKLLSQPDALRHAEAALRTELGVVHA